MTTNQPVIVELPLIHDEYTLAYVIDAETGAIFDEAGNMDTALTYANGNQYRLIAVRGTHEYGQDLTEAEVQKALDNETALYRDCFGIEDFADYLARA